jgi:hypothetical protein
MTVKSHSDLKQRVLAAARAVPSAVRADARSDARILFLTSAALAVALFLAFDGVSHAVGRPPWFLATSLATWTGVAAISARGAWRLSGSFVPGSGLQLATIALGTPLLLMAASLALARLWPGPASRDPPVSALPCLALTFAAAAYPLAGVLLLRRSTDPLHPIAGGAALGAASGATGGVMVALWCPVSDAAHVLSAHVLPVAALAALGATLGDRLLAMRLSARESLRDSARDAPREALRDSRETWDGVLIAKRFVSCDVTPMGDRVAGSRSRSMGVGDSKVDGGRHHGP